jgi:predicted RNase H-like HicB family nuclease
MIPSSIHKDDTGLQPTDFACIAALRLATLLSARRRMYRIWYWAMIERDDDGRFTASIPDLGDLAAYGDSDKDAVAHVTDLARELVRTTVENGQRIPPRRHFTEIPSLIRSKEIGRAIIPVEVERRAAWPAPPYQMAS